MKTVKSNKHNWILEDDLKVLFVFKYGFKECPFNRAELAELIGVSTGSLSYRIANFKAIEGIGSASNYAKLSKEVYDNYYHLSKKDLTLKAFKQ